MVDAHPKFQKLALKALSQAKHSSIHYLTLSNSTLSCISLSISDFSFFQYILEMLGFLYWRIREKFVYPFSDSHHKEIG